MEIHQQINQIEIDNSSVALFPFGEKENAFPPAFPEAKEMAEKNCLFKLEVISFFGAEMRGCERCSFLCRAPK